ncbi:MAG TPA: winged helix DNA-binding domain-containing protein, partial [Thermoleophilaceae bacterium]|nr:winged helix DNA-binding domain-containing protein [Thermoleophilaceae bacterium]
MAPRARKPEKLSRRQLNRATLARQLLLEREPISSVAALERLCGMQAQEPRPPFIGLWSRVEGFAREDLLGALEGRQAVRALLMRATLHLVSAADYPALQGALRPVLAQALSARGTLAKGLELDALLPVARELLAGEPHTFNELRPLLAKRFPEVNERALGYAVRTHLPLVMVPTEDRWGFPRDSSFALASEWLGDEPAEAKGPQALVLRYLAAFGPADASDAQTWCGLRGLKEVMEELRPKLRSFKDGRGRELFDLPDAPRPDEDVTAPARFLPDFDNLVLAHADRTRVLSDDHRAEVVTKNLRVRATFLWDGFVAGTWRLERKGKKASLEL